MKISAHVFITELYTVGVKVFGSGTRLYVTDTQKKPPKVSVYPVSNIQEEGQRVLLCQAQDMYPNLVQFSWVDPNGGDVTPSDGGDELLEQIDDKEVRITSMLILAKDKETSYEYTCHVKHEAEAELISQKIPIVTEAVAPKCVRKQEAEQEEELQEETLISGVLKLSRSLYLFSMTYVMLLVKNLLYFCTISVLLYMRSSANTEMIRVKAR